MIDLDSFIPELKRIQKKKYIALFAIAIFLGSVIYFISFAWHNPFWLISAQKNSPILSQSLIIFGFFGTFFFMVIAIWVYQDGQEELKELYKWRVLKELFKTIDPDAIYHPNSSMLSANEVKSIKLFPNFSRFKGEDHVVFEKTGVEYAEIFLGHEKSSFFHGSVYRVRFQTPAKAPVYIYSDRSMLKSTLFSIFNNDHMTLDNPKFEKYFDVSCSDSTYGYFILTPKLMEVLLDIQETYNKKMYIVFTAEWFYMFIDSDTNRFEPRYSLQEIEVDMAKHQEEFEKIIDFANTIRLEWHHIHLNQMSQ